MLPPENIAAQVLLTAGKRGEFHFILSGKIGRREIDGVSRKDAADLDMAGLKEIFVNHSCTYPESEGWKKARFVCRTPNDSEKNASIVCACQIAPIDLPATVTTWGSFYDWMLTWGNQEGRTAEPFVPRAWD